MIHIAYFANSTHGDKRMKMFVAWNMNGISPRKLSTILACGHEHVRYAIETMLPLYNSGNKSFMKEYHHYLELYNQSVMKWLLRKV